MNPQIFGKEHLIYIAVSLVVALAVCFSVTRFAKSEKARKVVMKCAGALLFLIILSNRLALVFEYETANWLKLITDSFCSTSSYVLALALVFGKRDNKVLHFVWLISLTGGVITTFYSNFIGQNPSFMYPPTILGMLHHTWSAVVVVLMFICDYLHLTYKKWYCTAVGFLAYLSLGAYLLCELDYSNPFYMMEPALDGTVFTVWGIAPIYAVAYALILLTVELVRKRRAGKTTDQ